MAVMTTEHIVRVVSRVITNDRDPDSWEEWRALCSCGWETRWCREVSAYGTLPAARAHGRVISPDDPEWFSTFGKAAL